MKTLIMALVLSTPAFAGSRITLGPGSTAEIKAGDTTTVTCSGSLPGNNACTCERESNYLNLYLKIDSGDRKELRSWYSPDVNAFIACKKAIKEEFAAICSQ